MRQIFCLQQYKVDTKKGFTLIELLVVIAIIGMLSSVVLSSLKSVRVKGRDVKRVADMMQIKTAVEFYASNNGGAYPNSDGKWTSFDAPSHMINPIVTPAATNITEALRPYLSSIPVDPKRLIDVDAGYLYRGNGIKYCILIHRTPENLNNFSKHLISPIRCTKWDSAGKCCVDLAQCPDGVSGGTKYNAIYTGVGSDAAGC